MASSFECQDCMGTREHGCYCAAMGAEQPGGPLPPSPRYQPCPCCDGAGEWDEGPLPASSGATEPDYRQVICPECEGTGRSLVECEPRTLDDLENEEWSAGTTKWFGDLHELSRGRAA